MDRITCEHCAFWMVLPNPKEAPADAPQSGGCHRHPPGIFRTSEGQPVALWPRTFPLDFCGEAVKETAVKKSRPVKA